MQKISFILILLVVCLFIFDTLHSLEAKQVNSDEPRGVIYFSNGTELIRYDFISRKKETLFKYQEESELGKRITHITYSAYLKSKNKILFIGSKNIVKRHIFEADLDLKNWKEYENTKDVGGLSLSPDESKIACYRYPNKLVVKEYEDLGKEGYEKIVVENASTGGRPLWISNSEIIFHSKTNDTVKVNINNETQRIVVNNLFPESISPDKKYMLCSNKDSIYLYDMVASQSKLLKKGMYFYGSSPNIWSPEGKYFLYSKGQKIKFTFNIVRLHESLTAEKRDICIYNLSTGKDEKLLENEDAIFGGFWIDKPRGNVG